MKEQRALLVQQNPQAGEQVAHFFWKYVSLVPDQIIGGYWPTGSELDLRPLLLQLIEKRVTCALPCVTPEGLVFRLWNPQVSLCKGDFGLQEPPSTSPLVQPHLLLVPLLAFDRRGHRLGYGTGSFDRFLHHFPTPTVGIGFAAQEVPKIPNSSYDVPLDGVLTEKGIFKRGRGDEILELY